jgi:ribosome biogenesis GTPase A
MKINWYPGHMAKTKRLIREQSKTIDLVIEVVDARIPHSSRIQGIEINKPHLVVMTKKDLCDISETNKWIEHYEKKGAKVLLIDLMNDKSVNKKVVNITNEIMKPLNDKRIARGLKLRKTRVLVLGVPNSGKSTLINRLVGRKVVVTGNKPGITKNLSWIRIDDNIELLDSPGILWPDIDDRTMGLNLASFQAIKEEILPLDEVATYIIGTLYKYYPDKLKDRYNLDTFDIEDLGAVFDTIGLRRGCLMRGNEIDYDKVINIIINDIKNGLVKGITFDRYN